MGKLGDALRKKYRTPRAALRALGLDEKLLDAAQIAFDGAQKMKKPTRLEFLATTRIARAVNPLLAFDAKVEYGPLLNGLTTKNITARKPKIISGLKTALKGKTLAGDSDLHMGHVAKMLDHLEGRPEKDSLDESVSGPQHRAMEEAAHGKSNLDIPKNVGEEFEKKDKGKTFGDMIKDWAKDKGLSEDDMEALDKMHADSMPKGLDEGEETNIEVEEGEDEDIEEEEAEDGDVEEEEAEDEIEEEEGEAGGKKAAKDKAAKDKAARDRMGKDKHAKDRKGAMDKRPITQDELNKAIAAGVANERKAARQAAEAREFVRPYVGAVSMALDSADKVYRSAAKAMKIEGAETVHSSALPQLIKMAGQTRATLANDQQRHYEAEDLAMDEGESDSFSKFFPGAAKIGAA